MKSWWENRRVKKFIGVLCITLGIISALTPFTPFGILFFIGLEILGVRTLIKNRLKK